MARTLEVSFVRTAAFLLPLVVACSSTKLADGDSCEKNSECSSGQCLAGSCGGSECMCETSACRSQASCQPGWLCVHGTGSTVVPHCLKQCGNGISCSDGYHCDTGVCKPGPEPFSLSWTNLPRAKPCAANLTCVYDVKPSAGVIVDRYTWAFGTAPTVETKEPSASYKFATRGSYDVTVRATASNGATAELTTSEVVCGGVVGDACDPVQTVCCEGSCVVDTCR